MLIVSSCVCQNPHLEHCREDNIAITAAVPFVSLSESENCCFSDILECWSAKRTSHFCQMSEKVSAKRWGSQSPRFGISDREISRKYEQCHFHGSARVRPYFLVFSGH